MGVWVQVGTGNPKGDWPAGYVIQENGCWDWTGAIYPNGYGAHRKAGFKGMYAHRVMYQRLVGPIPLGLTIDHLCRNRRCVNPAHLEPVTKRTNTLRGVGGPAVNAKKTHCIHGHPFSGENLWVERTGSRHCRTCHRNSQARFTAAKNALGLTREQWFALPKERRAEIRRLESGECRNPEDR